MGSFSMKKEGFTIDHKPQIQKALIQLLQRQEKELKELRGAQRIFHCAFGRAKRRTAMGAADSPAGGQEGRGCPIE